MTETKKINSDIYLKKAPILEDIKGIIASGPLAGSPVEMAWGGSWTAKASCFYTAMEIPKEDMVVDTDIGTFIIYKSMVNSSNSNGTIKGKGVFMEYAPLPKTNQKVKYVCMVTTQEKLTSAVCFHDWHEDITTGAAAAAWLPLSLAICDVDILFIEKGPVLVLESVWEQRDDEKWNAISGAVRSFLSYLFGVSLYGDSCKLVLDMDDNILSTYWYKGRNIGSLYQPAPINWSEWNSAKRKLNFTEPKIPLDDNIISKCIDKYLSIDELMVTNDYLLAFSWAPLEMRGALLSVALESLTSHLKQIGIIDFENTMIETTWIILRDKLKQELNNFEPKLDATQSKIFHSKIDQMNGPTNASKLMKPFDVLGVIVSEDEIKAIESRNKFLHRGFIINRDLMKTDTDAWKQAYITEMRMYSAINRLYLKYLGYKGPIYDWGSRDIGGFESVFLMLE